MAAVGKRSAPGRGFTLIELLVVVAIIALLASIVLASLGTARTKAKDAAVQSDLDAVRTQAELARAASCYPGSSGICATGPAVFIAAVSCAVNFPCSHPSVAPALIAAQTAGGGLVSLQSPAGGTAYAYAIQLASDKALAWCIDSSGQSKREGTPGGTALTQTTLNALVTGYTTCL